MIESENKRNQYNCDGEQTVFPYTFRILEETHLEVTLTDSEGDDTVLTLTSDYTVSGVGDAGGGDVTTIDTYAEGYTLTIVRDVPLTQKTDYIEDSKFPSASHEDALDKLTMIAQALSEQLDRVLSLATGSTFSGLTLPDPVGSKLLAWKDDLSGIKNIGIESEGDLEVTEFIKTLLDDESLEAARTTLAIPVAPVVVGPPAFMPEQEDYDWIVTEGMLANRSTISNQNFYALVSPPHGAIVTKLTLHAYRIGAPAAGVLSLRRVSKLGGATIMASVTADWTGEGSGDDEEISNPVIDCDNYHYVLRMAIDPDDSGSDIKFRQAQIFWEY